MRWHVALMLGGIIGLGAQTVRADERSIVELPRDAWGLAFSWTEPIKQAARQSRRSDPVSGLWFGMLDGSVKSMEKTAGFLLAGVETASSERAEPSAPSLVPSRTTKTKPHALFRYSF